MATPATPEQIAARQAEAAIIAGGTPTPPSASTTTPAPTTPATVPTTPAPVVTTATVRGEFDKNAEKLAKESEKYAYDNILSPNVTGRTTPTTPTQPAPTPITPTPTPTTPTTPGTAPVESEYTKTLRDIEAKRKAEFDKMDLAAQERQKLYDQYKATSDDAHKALLDNVRTAFEQTRARMVDTNSRFNNITRQNQYLINGFRYTPQQAEGMVYDTEQAGLSRLAEIDLKYADALQKAQTAKDDKDYKNLNDMMTNLDNLAKDRATALRDMATGAADIEKSLNNVENMNENQATAMNNMLEGYGIDLEGVPEKDREKWYKEKAKEISDITGTEISATFVKSQMARYNKQNLVEKNAPNMEMSQAFGVYTNARGEPIKTADGKTIRYTPNDKTIFNDKTGQLTIFSRDAYGNPTEQVVNVAGYTPEATTPWQKLSDGSLYNQETGEIKAAGSVIPGVDVIPLASDAINKYIAECRENGQCGEGVNDYLQKIGGQRTFGDGYDKDVIVNGVNRGSKTKFITPGAGAIPGAIAIWNPQSNSTGHVAVVVQDNGNGTIRVHDWNWDGKGNQKTHDIPKSQITDTGGGFHIPDALKNTTKGGFSDSDIELLAELANMEPSARNTALKAQGIPLQRVTDYMAAAKSGKIPPTTAQKQSGVQIMSQIQDLAQMDWNDATGMWRPSWSGGDRATALGKIESLIAAITLPNLGMLKGPMSDKDLAFIQNASTRLNATQSDAEFEKQIVELYNIAARKNGMKEIKKVSEIPEERILPGQNLAGATTESTLSKEEEDILNKYGS